MKVSCIQHPAKEPLIVIRQWQIEACDGDPCAAALLSFFEYWHNIKLEIMMKDVELNGTSMSAEQLLQHHSFPQLKDGILIYGRTKIVDAVKFLESKNFISVYENPSPYHGWDRTNHYLFHAEAVQDWIDKEYLPQKQEKDALLKSSFRNGRCMVQKRTMVVQKRTMDDSETDDGQSESGRTSTETSVPETPVPETTSEKEFSNENSRTSDSENPEVLKAQQRRERIEEIYQAYPRKVGKAKALPAIEKAISRLSKGTDKPNDESPDLPRKASKWLLARVKLYAQMREGGDEKYTPHPATWFSDARYIDDVEDWQRQTERERGKQNKDRRTENASNRNDDGLAGLSPRAARREQRARNFLASRGVAVAGRTDPPG